MKSIPSVLNAIRIKNFSRVGLHLRSEFESVFSDERSLNPKRFVWDHWHVANQYQMLRTPADAFFDKKIFSKWMQELLAWGQQNLGCHSLSTPWLSCYVDGGFQNLHTDIGQGPWAFVYSLSPERAKFSGGFTQVLRSKWLSPAKDKYGHEVNDLLERIPATFNQLTIFDPSFPHGVERVDGVHNVLDGRLVLHGWFGLPTPFVVGGLKRESTGLRKALKELLALFSQSFNGAEFAEFDSRDYFNFEFLISSKGLVTGSRIFPLHASTHAKTTVDHARRLAKYFVAAKGVGFPAASQSSRVYLPIYF